METPSINILPKLKTFSKYFAATTLLLIGILGIGLVSYNPLNITHTYLPINFGTLTITQEFLQTNLNIFYADYYMWGGTIAGSIIAIIVSLVLFSNNPRQLHKTLIHSPIVIYRKLQVGRDKLLKIITYLNEESAKWRMAFNVLKSPYSLLRAAGFSPQMAIGLIFAGTAAGGGVVVNETVFAERSFQRGDSGVYAASLIGDAPLDIPTEYVEGSNTLRIDLGSTPVREITIENVSVGTVFTGSALPSGETNVVQVSGNVVSGGTNTRLEIGHFILENSRCKKLTLTDIQAHTIIVRGNASDGQSIAPSPGTSRMRAIGGGHQQADAMVTNGGTYDRIWIQAPSSGVNGKIGTLRLTNLYTKGGDCVFSKMDIGKMELLLNEIGEGNGFATKEFSISSTVTGANITLEDNVEVTIAEPTTTTH